ncbi:HipA domain-containing protein [Pseudomonas luteola]|nr:HipA domain-containing protein [Pseudomonas luteola]
MLNLWFNDELIGELVEVNNVWSFTYSDYWVARKDAFDLSPSLSKAHRTIVDGSTERPVQWFFDNLLPEEDARTLMARDAKIEAANAFGLLAWYGAESAGALTLLPPDQVATEGDVRRLHEAELSERIRRLPQLSLSAQAPKRMSLAGAQHKLAVVLERGELFEPEGARASTHILKPDHPNNELYEHSVANEWFVMRLAERTGLSVPRVEMRHVPEAVYLVERFDRHHNGVEIYRRHVLDACQLMSLDRHFKYSEATFDTLKKLINYCRERLVTRQALFRWLLFNTLVGNGDAHMKNLSFFVDDGVIKLTPHYDLLSTTVYAAGNNWLDCELSWPLNELRLFRDMSRGAVRQMAQAIGIPKRMCDSILNEMLSGIGCAADDLLKEAEGQATSGELRLLRKIRHGPIADMLRLLRKV